jgi:hypothetical protein
MFTNQPLSGCSGWVRKVQYWKLFPCHFALANIGLLLYDNAYLCKCGNIHAVRRADRRAFGAKRHRRKKCAQTYPLAKTKPPGLDEPSNPSVTGSLGRSIPGTRSGQRDSLFRRMSSLFTSNKFPVWLGQGICPQCTEMAAQIDTRSRQRRQKKRNSLLISLLSGNPRIAARSRLAALRLRTAAA